MRPLGWASKIPLCENYAGKTLKRIQQDVYDRFFTRIEQRFSRKEISTLSDTYTEIRFSEPPLLALLLQKIMRLARLSLIRHWGRR
jgi:hypothetical protein